MILRRPEYMPVFLFATASTLIFVVLGFCEPLHVDNPKPGTLTRLRKMNLTQELSIGVEDGDSNYVFGRVVDLAVNSKRDIFVLDTGFLHVQQYDSNGVYIRTIGRQGEGPGDFRLPSALSTETDTLYVADVAKIAVFNNMGEFVRAISLPRTDGPISSVIVDDNHDIYFSGVSLASHRVIHKYRWREDRITSFCETYTESGFIGEHSKGEVERFYGGGRMARDGRNRILFTRTVPYEIRRFSADGELLTVIARDHDYPKLHGIVIADEKRFNPKPDQLFLSRSIIPLSDGTFLNVINAPRPAGDSREGPGTTIDWFDESGVLLTSMQTTPWMTVRCVDRVGRLYGYEFKDSPRVVRYRMEPPR